MKKTMKGMLGILLISMVMFSCKKEDPPVADFSASATDVFTGAVVTFTDLSTNSPSTWDWNFGDQTASTEQNPTHTYTVAGVYTVSLTTTNEGGSNTATKTDYITVTVELTKAEKLVAYVEDPSSPAKNYGNTDVAAIKTADHVHTQWLLQNVHIIDIRSDTDYDAGHIDGAVNMGEDEVLDYLETTNLDAFGEIAIVCASGQTAGWVTSLARLLGYDKVYSMKWGMCSWHSDFSGSWNGAPSNGGIASFDKIAVPKGAPGELPDLSTTSGSTGQEILESRIDAVEAEGFTGVNILNSVVLPNRANYYIVNYWSLADYDAIGHIIGSMQYTPKGSLASDADLLTLPTDKTIVIYCHSGQNSAGVACYLRVLGYDAKSLKFGTNNMIYDSMTGGKWNGALAPDGLVFDYDYVLTTK